MKAIVYGVLFFFTATAAAAEKETSKRITVLKATTEADGASAVSEKLLEECIVFLPETDDLEAAVTSRVAYLKEIDGNPGKNEFAKIYSATVEINYLLRQRSLIIITTRSIEKQEPVLETVEKNLRQSIRFESDPSAGEHFAGRSQREYYFPTAEAAEADAKRRAAIWLKQQEPVVCPESSDMQDEE